MKNCHLLGCFLVILCGSHFVSAQAPAPSVGRGSSTSDEEMAAGLNLDTPGLEKVKAAIQAHDLAAAKRAYLEYRRTASPARWTVMPGDRPARPMATDDSLGDDVVAHRIRNNYGLKPEVVDMGRDFDWQHNPLSKGDASYSSEWTWCAVARTEFWRTLADAYWKTGDEKFAEAWASQLMDFAAKNPAPSPGTNCERTDPPSLWRGLDTGIRMFNSWPYAYAHFLRSPAFTPEVEWSYLKLVHDHGRVLKEDLADLSRTGNHITNTAYGLYAVGVLFPEFREAKDWRETALNRLGLELDRCVPPDGMEAELTPSYHIVVLDNLLGPLRLAKLNNLQIPANFRARIISMYRALVLMMDQSGKDVPTNDSGIEDARREARKGLELAADPLLEWAATSGEHGKAPPDSTFLPYAGFYAMRSGWKLDDLFLFFRAGPPGIGHEHEDMLEVVLRAWNKTLLFDEGRHDYDHSDFRRYSLGTSSHSTITVDGKGQHRGTDKKPLDRAVDNPWVTTPLFDFVAGTYRSGYQANVYDPKREYQPMTWVGEVDHSITHTRRVLFLKPYYALVVDTLDGTGEHTFDAHFQVDAPSAKVDSQTNVAFSERTDGVQLGLYPLEKDHLSVEVVQGQTDPILGWIANHQEKRPVPTVRFRKKQSAPALFATFLYPYQGVTPPPVQATPLATLGDGVWSRTLATQQENIEVTISNDAHTKKLSIPSAIVPGLQVEAAGFIARRSARTREVFQGGWGMASYRSANISFTLSEPGNLAFTSGAHLLFYNGGEKEVALTLTAPFATIARLNPGEWTDVTRESTRPAQAPVLFGSP